jgi:hypothetical protein
MRSQFMAIIAEVSWDDFATGNLPESHFRKAFRQAVQDVAEKAREALPEANGRIDRAVKLVLAGDVELLDGGNSAKVASHSNGTTTYVVVNGECQCKDFPNAPGNFCAHRLAYGIAKRATALAQQRLEAQAEGTTPAPVAPASTTPTEVPGIATIPPQFLTEIHGKHFVQYAGLLSMAHDRGLVNLSAHFISVNDDLALAEATAEFADGKIFMECADSTPSNVNPKVKQHFPRMALTRAKARALRDALNISMVAVEELEG